MKKYSRTYTVIDENKIKDNLIAMKILAGKDVKMLAVIKADAYGHGAVETAKAIDELADYYGVATIDEALELRNAGIFKDILVLGYLAHEDYFDIIEKRIVPVIYRYEDAYILNSLAEKRNTIVKVHLAVDTGMGRIGFRNDKQGIKEANKVFELKNIFVEGMFSHFACADMEDGVEYTEKQAEVFNEFLNSILAKDIMTHVHLSNSAGIIQYNYHYDMVRDGISLYGYYPSDEVDKSAIELKPALEWHAHVTNIKTISAGESVSYGATYTADKDTVVATVSVGYADGYSRKMSNTGKVLVGGSYANVIGRVCMDQIMVDITGIDNVNIEDDVVLIGKQGNNVITADDIANWTGTISYEVLCNISKRVKRTYI